MACYSCIAYRKVTILRTVTLTSGTLILAYESIGPRFEVESFLTLLLAIRITYIL
jgi:hypothetical protein